MVCSLFYQFNLYGWDIKLMVEQVPQYNTRFYQFNVNACDIKLMPKQVPQYNRIEWALLKGKKKKKQVPSP